MHQLIGRGVQVVDVHPHLSDLGVCVVGLRQRTLLVVLQMRRRTLDLGDRQRIERPGVIVNEHRHAHFEPAQTVTRGTSRFVVDFELRRLIRHRRRDRRLRDGLWDVHERDAVAPKPQGPVIDRGIRALFVRQNGREEVVQRAGLGAGVRPGARHQDVLVQRVDADAQALLHVGNLELRLERAVRGIHDGKDAGGDRQHDGHRHQHFHEAESTIVRHARSPSSSSP